MFNRRDFLKFAAGTIFFSAGHPKVISKDRSVKQDVLLSFDGGTRDYGKMREILRFSDELSSITGERANFTFFMISCLYFSSIKRKTEINLNGNRRDIEGIIEMTQIAIDAGHDLGNHSVRHLHGENWSYQQWFDELSEFDGQIAGLFRDVEGKPYKARGFRAPYLEWGESMFPVLRDLDYSFDSSPIGDEIKTREGIVSIELPVWRRDNGKRILSMDWNWGYWKVSNAELQNMLQRESSRNPLIISLHFEDYGSGESQTYYEIVADFLRQGTREGRFRFPSMKEYVKANFKSV